MCDKYVIQPGDIITYGPLVKEAMCEYLNIAETNQWEPTDSNRNRKDEPLLLKASTVEIEAPVNKIVEKVYF